MDFVYVHIQCHISDCLLMPAFDDNTRNPIAIAYHEQHPARAQSLASLPWPQGFGQHFDMVASIFAALGCLLHSMSTATPMPSPPSWQMVCYPTSNISDWLCAIAFDDGPRKPVPEAFHNQHPAKPGPKCLALGTLLRLGHKISVNTSTLQPQYLPYWPPSSYSVHSSYFLFTPPIPSPSYPFSLIHFSLCSPSQHLLLHFRRRFPLSVSPSRARA